MSDFSELETELKKLRPAPVPAGLLARVEHALAQPAAMPTAGLLPRRAKRSNAWWSLGLGLTTASALRSHLAGILRRTAAGASDRRAKFDVSGRTNRQRLATFRAHPRDLPSA